MNNMTNSPSAQPLGAIDGPDVYCCSFKHLTGMAEAADSLPGHKV